MNEKQSSAGHSGAFDVVEKKAYPSFDKQK